MKILILTSILIFSFNLKANETGCLLKAKDLPVVGTQIVTSAVAEKRSVDDSLNIQSTASGILQKNLELEDATFEGFYRPDKDGFYSLLPIPLFGFQLSREKNMIYVCFHMHRDPLREHLTIYLLKGSHLDPTSMGNIMGNLFSSPKLEVSPLTPILFGTPGAQVNGNGGTLGAVLSLPAALLSLNSGVTGRLQSILSQTFGQMTGLAIERIILTRDKLEISSGVNLDNPSEARFTKVFPLNQ